MTSLENLLDATQYLAHWQQIKQEPSLELFSLDVFNEAPKNKKYTEYFRSVMVDAIFHHQNLVVPVLHSNLADKVKKEQRLPSRSNTHQDFESSVSSENDRWGDIILFVIEDLSSYEIYDDEGLHAFLSYLVDNFETFQNSSSDTPKSVLIMLALTDLSYEDDRDIPLLGYSLIEKLLPLCSDEEKELFCNMLLSQDCFSHTLDFVIKQKEKGSLVFPHNMVTYKEVLSFLFFEEMSFDANQLEEPSQRVDIKKAIDLLEDKSIRNALIRDAIQSKQYNLSQGHTSFPNIDRVCSLLPQEDVIPLVEYLLQKLPLNALPPFLKSCYEKDLLCQEVSIPDKKPSIKKM